MQIQPQKQSYSAALIIFTSPAAGNTMKFIRQSLVNW